MTHLLVIFFFFNDTATTEIYTLSLHDALPICGDEYFREQEGQAARSARARWMAGRIAAYRPGSILEVGCGYGKQLLALRGRLPNVPLVGLDFSPTQLGRARLYLDRQEGIDLVLGSGARSE